jgi:hypothetical protein
MTRFNVDWSYLKAAVVISAITFLLGAALMTFSVSYRLDAEERLATEERELYALSSKYRKARQDKILIDEYMLHYYQLEQQGMVGKERRLNWVDTLRASVKLLEVPHMHFQFAPQRVLQKNIISAGSNLVVNASHMKLDVGLLHEVDLLQLFSELEYQVTGMFHIDSCSIELIGQDIVLSADHSNLNVNCDLQWFTIDFGEQQVAKEMGP